MRKIDLQSLIDRVIGKEGILRVPAYWMRRVLYNLMEFSEKTAESQAKKALTDAKTYADATSKEYTDQQIAELGVTGKEPIVYVLPERIWDKVTDFKEYRFSYTLTEAEANEFWAAMDKGIDNILFVIGRYGSLITPRNVAQVMKVKDDWYLLLGDEFLNGVGGIWYTWRPGVNLEFNASTREVEVEVVTTKTNIDIQGMIDSSIGDINTILDNINGEEV